MVSALGNILAGLGKDYAWLAPVMVLGIWANMAWK